MILRLVTYSDKAIKQVRRRLKHGNANVRCTFRRGTLYTRRYTAPVQPRSESQQTNWSLFAEANARVASDFSSPSRKAHWVRLQKSQSRYKTARGLARSYYISVLKNRIRTLRQDVKSSCLHAARSLRPAISLHPMPSLSTLTSHKSTSASWIIYRNVHWFRSTLHQLVV